jgi:5'-nucleotidase
LNNLCLTAKNTERKWDGIGFIGVVTKETPTLVVPSGVEGLTFTNEVEAINRIVAELKNQGVRSIIVLAHNPGTSGINGENPTGVLVDMANNVDDEVDIIFGGHNHAYSLLVGEMVLQYSRKRKIKK